MPRESGRTRERLQSCALRLFTEHGYAQTSVADVAREAGVSHMTFFRHFPTKESVVVADPFDPLIADLVAARPSSEPALTRVVRGIVEALHDEESGRHLSSPEFRARVVLASSVPELRSATWVSSEASRTAVARALMDRGVAAYEAEAASGAVIGAATAVLLAWAADAAESPDAAGESPQQVLVDGLTALLAGSGVR